MLPMKTNIATTDYVDSNEYDEKHHYLRKSEGNWSVLRAGFVIAQPEEGVAGSGAGDDTVFVLSGEAHVTVAGSADPIILTKGDFVSFPKGTPQTWNIVEEFRAVFVYAE
jgi:mannose-6-phosphate isomerase-like protein (cupin superfamily)